MNNKKPISNATLILANLVPLIGVLFLHWDAKGVFVIYIIETLIVGVLNVVKMLVVLGANGSKKEPDLGPESNVKGWGIIPFFIFHYFFFVFIQSVMFFAFSSIWDHSQNSDPSQIIDNFRPYFFGATSLAVGSLLIANLTYFTEGFIMNGKYRTETMTGLMFQPYKRIILQQFVVILGGFIFMLSGSATAVAILFILLKIAADYLSANYNRNTKLKNWATKKMAQNSKKPLTEAEKMMVEKMFEE